VTVRRARDAVLPALVLAAALLAVGCTTTVPQGEPGSAPAAPAPQPKRGGVLALLMNQGGDPPSFDLHQESSSAAIEAAGPVYDTLLMFDPADPRRLIPNLADRWDVSPDGRTYTFHLRREVRFHNGTPLTAGDVAFSYERMRNPPAGMVSPRRTVFDAVSGVEAVDAATVRLQLSRPNPSLLGNLAQGWMAVYSREAVLARGQESPKREPMGSGPYRFKEYTPSNSVVLERNPGYFLPGRPYLDGIQVFVVPDPTARTAALRTGRAMIGRLFFNDYQSLQQELGDRMVFHTQTAPSFGALYMNVNRKPFDDPNVRRAVALAVDRYAGVQLLSQGQGEVGGYLMPGGAWALPADEVQRLPGYRRDKGDDLAAAQRLMAEAGHAGGANVEIVTRSARTFQDLAVFSAAQLKRLNITARITPLETAIATERARRGDFQLLTWGHEFSTDDPDAVYAEFYTCDGPRNWSGLCSPETDRLFRLQSAELDPARRRALVQEMERAALPLASKVITHWNRRHDAWWAYVKGYVQHPSPFTNVSYSEVWLDR
jgi:peptide/nickel transport system substrate-binding protein